MAKNPAFNYYYADAASDVAHMNRLERGCYFDLIHAQKKFGKLPVEQIKKILGKDYEQCWPALEMVLFKEDDLYFIEWVYDSIEQRKQHSLKQKENIGKRWNNKKHTEPIPPYNDGTTAEIPLVNAIVNVNTNVNTKKGGTGENEGEDVQLSVSHGTYLTGLMDPDLLTEKLFLDKEYLFAIARQGPDVLTEPVVYEWMKSFNSSLRFTNGPEIKKTEKDYRLHFARWLAMQDWQTTQPQDYKPVNMHNGKNKHDKPGRAVVTTAPNYNGL